MTAMAARVSGNTDDTRRIDMLDERTAMLRDRFDDLRQEMSRGDAALRSEMNRGFTAVDQRISDLRTDMVRGDEALRETIDRRIGELRADMVRGDEALSARIDKLDHKLTWFFGTLLTAILAQMAIQLLR
jgi:hypothetical protein